MSTTSQDAHPEAQAYLDAMVRRRGYVLELHKGLVLADFPFAKACNDLGALAYMDQRLLSRATKELLFVTSLVALRAPKSHIQGHIRVALACGLSPEEILEAIEIVMPEAGIVAFQEGFVAWAEVVGAGVLEPSPEAWEAARSEREFS